MRISSEIAKAINDQISYEAVSGYISLDLILIESYYYELETKP